MPALSRYILLAAIPGLMFCIIPIDGMPFRFSWELVSIWLAGVIFAAWLSSWWWRIFFLLALGQAIIHGAIITAYMTLVLVGIFLAAAQGFSRLEVRGVLNAICVAGLLLSLWILLQEADILPRCSLGESGAGPFNRNAASVFLACSLTAFYRKREFGNLPWRHAGAPICWWHLSPFVIGALFACRSSCGVVAAIAGVGIFFLFSRLRRWIIAVGPAITLLLAGFFFWRIDPVLNGSGPVFNERWGIWLAVIRAFRAEPFGLGLGSFSDLFPAMSGRPGWQHAHNEYLQVGFEMGMQALALVLIYLGCFFVSAWRRRKSMSDHGRIVVSGMAALAVSCAGWHTFHIPPLAVIGAAWVGQARRIEGLRDLGI